MAPWVALMAPKDLAEKGHASAYATVTFSVTGIDTVASAATTKEVAAGVPMGFGGVEVSTACAVTE